MKKLIALVFGLTLALSSSANNDEILKKIEAMQEDLRAQQSEIQTLRQQLNENNSQVSAVRGEIDRAMDTASWAQAREGGMLTLNKHITNLTLKGDLRLRYEAREVKDTTSETSRDRFRTRLRIGGVWETPEGWEIGVGLASGGSGATSTNDTWSQSSPFETGDIRIDYAYAKHSWEGEGSEFSLALGQHKNPYVTSFLLWDGDVRPAGVTAMYEAAGFFATAGGYDVRYLGNNDNANLLAGQVGWEGDLGNDMSALIAAAYYYFDNQTAAVYGSGDGAYDFHVGDLYGELSFKVQDVGLSIYGDVFQNFGADGASLLGGSANAGDQDLGWVAGIGAKMGDFSLKYAYGYIEADAMVPVLKDSDFGGTAGLSDNNVEGHKLGAGYKFTKNFSLGLTAMFLEEIEGDEDGNLYQVDLSYKF